MRRTNAQSRSALATTAALVAIGAGAAVAGAQTTLPEPSTDAVAADFEAASGLRGGGVGSGSGGNRGNGGGGNGPGTGGTGTDEPGDGQGGGGKGGGGGITVVAANVRPGTTYMFGKRDATFSYAIDAAHERALKIKLAKRKNDRVVRTWHRESVEPGVQNSVRWDGRRDGRGYPGKGEYVFRVFSEAGGRAKVGKRADDRRVLFYKYKFPIRGPHTYGDGVGAPRGDHTHQGQDLAAACGTRLVAARGGTVQWQAYQAGGAGYYVVIDGRDTGKDYVYMHLDGPAIVKQGERVATGERIGRVGTSGSSTGCHLHFEIWSGPGWYEGGSFTNPRDDLRKWDTWS